MASSQLVTSTTILFLIVCSSWQLNEAFQPHLKSLSHHHHHLAPFPSSRSPIARSTTTSTILREKYTKGAEIYPATNENQFKLTDSFPGGVLPPSVQATIDNVNLSDEEIKDEEEMEGDIPTTTTVIPAEQIPKRTRVKKVIQKILRSAAESETETAPLVDNRPLDKRPTLIAAFLMVLGLIKPNHFLTVVFMSGYLIALGLLSSSPKSVENMNPILWSMPPQGHVPSLLSNPLGSIGNSQNYFSWLRIGVVFGYVTPFIYLFQTILAGHKHLSETIASNIFLMSCQIMTEGMARKVLTPLPIRILIPLIYNSLRMGPLYQWMMCWSTMSNFGKILSVTNFVYWGANLFLFLIPIASLRYMRSYFFCVEAEEVVVRDGDEDNIGLLGR